MLSTFGCAWFQTVLISVQKSLRQHHRQPSANQRPQTYKTSRAGNKSSVFQRPQCCWSFISPFPSFFLSFFPNKGGSGGHIVNNGIVIHHLIMIWQMLAPSPFSASSSLSILRSAKLSRTPPVGLIRAVCLCEAAGALRAAGARHCQWTESLTLPGSRT